MRQVDNIPLLGRSLFFEHLAEQEAGGWVVPVAAAATAAFPCYCPLAMDAVAVYHGKISREMYKAPARHGPDGSYLLRDSECSPQCLCVLWVHDGALEPPLPTKCLTPLTGVVSPGLPALLSEGLPAPLGAARNALCSGGKRSLEFTFAAKRTQAPGFRLDLGRGQQGGGLGWVEWPDIGPPAPQRRGLSLQPSAMESWRYLPKGRFQIQGEEED